MRKITLRLLLAVAIMALAGCAAGGKRVESQIILTEGFKLFNGEYEPFPALEDHLPRSIAVLPFKGHPESWAMVPEDMDPAELVRRGMYNHVSSLPFTDLELRETDRRLANNGLATTQSVAELLSNNPRKLRSILGVDAVITGDVTHFDRNFLGIASQVAVGCEISLIDLESGKLLWRAKHVARELSGGISLNPIGLAMSAMSSLWNIREEQLYRKTDDLFREIALALETTLPESAQRRTPDAPALDFFALLSDKATFRAGDELRFRLVGEPDSEAYVDLSDFKTGIRLLPVPAHRKEAIYAETMDTLTAALAEEGKTLKAEEKEAVLQALRSRQIYEGSIIITPDQNADTILARGYLISPNGGMASAFFNDRLLTIDSTPPLAPLRPLATPLDGAIDFKWSASPSQDVRYYEVQAAIGDAIDFSPLAKTGDITIRLAGLDNFTPVKLRVIAVDHAGNTSDATRIIRTVPVPDRHLNGAEAAPRRLSGDISAAMRMTADRSPYIITDDVTISTGGTLYIEAGSTLLFSSGTALTVNGGTLSVMGSAENPVSFSPQAGVAATGAWEGLVLQSGKAEIHHSVIESSNTGINISQMAAELDSVTIRNSARAGIHIRSGANLAVSCSSFLNNQGQGALVIEGNATPTIVRSVFAGNAPFDVQNFSPLSLQLSENFWKDGSPKVLGNVETEPALSTAPTCATTAN